MAHTYELKFTLHLRTYSFQTNRVMTSRLPWTPDNKPKVEKRAKVLLDYMFESWSAVSVEPVCSCCQNGGGE